MKRAGWVVLGAVLILFGVIGLFVAMTSSGSREDTLTFGDVSELRFDVANSPIVVNAGGEQAVVEMSASTGLFGGDVTVEQDGGTLEIIHECPFLIGWSCRASFEVTVPAVVSVDGSTSNGSISVTAIEGPISVTTSNGPITIDATPSTIFARTSNGPIIGSGLSGENVEVSTSNGRIVLEFDQPPTSLRATTSNGAIEVTLPPDAPPYSFDTSTSNGRVVTDIRTDPTAAGLIVARTSNGNITLVYRD
jgi:phage baseplate assembly protein gpV